MMTLIKSLLPLPLRNQLSRMGWVVGRVGPLAAFTLMSGGAKPAAVGSPASRRVRRLKLKGYRHPLYYRTGTSDLDVIRQVFVDREYECIGDEADVRLVIDCGANIGCTSAYFLRRYPLARVISIEPDPGNLAICRRNLTPYGERSTLIHSAIWPTPAPMRIERGGFRDGREWAFQVSPAAEGQTPDLIATTIDELIDGSGADRADILKIDIEGAEAALFREGPERWLPRTRHLVIELHGPECERAFEGALSGYRYESSQHGELTLCKNLASPTLPAS